MILGGLISTLRGQKEASDKSDIFRKRAKCVCHFHWQQWNIMMSYLTYLLAGWVFIKMHKIWPGRRAQYRNLKIQNIKTLKPQDSFGRFGKNFLDHQKVDHTIRKHHETHRQLFLMTCCNVIIPNNKISLCILPMAECSGGPRTAGPEHFDIFFISWQFEHFWANNWHGALTIHTDL